MVGMNKKGSSGYELADLADIFEKLPDRHRKTSLAEVTENYANLSVQRKKKSDGINETEALMNLVKALIGTGMMSLPFALHCAGLWTGIVLLLFTVFLSIHCMRQLVRAAHYFNYLFEVVTTTFFTGLSSFTYAELGALCCTIGPAWLKRHSNKAKIFIIIELCVTQLGICCVYFVFIAENTKQALQKFMEGYTIETTMLLILPFILIVCSIRKLRYLAFIAGIANIMFLIAFGVTLQYIMRDLPPISRLPAFNSFSTLPLAFGTIVFSFEGINLVCCIRLQKVLPIENRSRNPRQFIAPAGTLNIACLLVLAIYIVIGFFGYAKFGFDIKDSVTLNLPSNDPLYQAVKGIIAASICLSYPVQFFVPMELLIILLREHFDEDWRWFWLTEYACRYLLVALTFSLAELIPHLALFVSLVGALTCSSLALIFPPIMELLIECYGKPRTVVWLAKLRTD
ncbi:putative proton-coupled amino acid transporter 2 [Trichuris suis]|nr:putative proton-coupled amino acid transporter 2 [Trichuris suis]